MREKRLDAKNRWRNVVVAFRMSPEEAQELNVKVALSGLSKQDYIIQCLLKHEVRVVAGKKVARKMQMYLEAMLEELQFLQDENMSDIDFDEMLMPLKHILTILKETEQKADAFKFNVSDAGGNLKLFMSVLDKLGVKLDGDQLYEEYQKIYDETVSRNEKEQEKQWNKGRGKQFLCLFQELLWWFWITLLKRKR